MTRVAIFAAVSSDEQVTDKDSIPKQIQMCREAAARMGFEVVGEYIADGYSRSGYWDLSAARVDIPPLNDCLNDIDKYDVLFIKNYDRFGSLTENIFNFFADRRKQLYSCQQATEVYDPATYNPKRSISGIVLAKASGITQAYRLSKLADGLDVGLPKRARDGKYARKPAYGYSNVGDKKHYKLELDPVFKAIAIQLVELYLKDGYSLQRCAEYADRVDPGKNWNGRRVKYIFTSPFYAGYTYWRRFDIDPVTQTAHRLPNPELFQGQHESCWDMDTYYQLVAEVERRGEYGKRKRTYPLSGLVVCGKCGGGMQIQPSKNQQYIYYQCKPCNWRIREGLVNDHFVEQIRGELYKYEQPHKIPAEVDNTKAIARKEKELRKIQLAYRTTDGYTPEEFDRDAREIRAQIALLKDQQYQREKQRRELEQADRGIRKLREIVDRVDMILTNLPASEINAGIAQAVRSVTVSPDKNVTIQLL